MSAILTYRPQYEYKRKLEAVLRDTGVAALVQDLGHGPDAGVEPLSPAEQLRRDGEAKNYNPSTPLLDYLEITPTDVLQGYLEAKRGLSGLKTKIIGNLTGRVTVGPDITEYIGAKGENKDLDTVFEFEDFHADRIEGLTEAEVLPVIQDFLEELDSLREFLDANIGPIIEIEKSEELIEDGTLVNPALEKAREAEAAEIEQMIQLDRARRLDMGRANERNHLLGFLDTRFESLKEFASEVDSLITDTSEAAYGGAGAQIQESLNNLPSLAAQFERTNLERFRRHAENTNDAYARMRRIVTNGYKQRLLDEVVKAQSEKLEARAYLEQVQALNPEKEDDPFNLFLLDMLASIEEIRGNCDRLVEDLYRINELEQIQNVDYLQSLRQKHEVRHVYQMLNG